MATLSSTKTTTLYKANMLIGAKYRATLQELRVTYAALFAIQAGAYEEKPDGIYVTMKAGELRTLVNGNGGSFYKQLAPVAQSMTSRSMGIIDSETESFDFISLITRATYKDGVFTCVFNNALKNYIVSLKRDYTSLPKKYIMLLDTSYAFRLYELLRKSCYYMKSYNGEKTGSFEFEISLAELKLDLGVVNSALDSVQRELRDAKQPNYERAVEASPEKLYNTWSSFKQGCLDKAIAEINKKTDISVSYTTQRSGKGGKVYSLLFQIYFSALDEHKAEPVVDPSSKFDFYARVSKAFPMLSYDDVLKISDKLEYNIERLDEISKLYQSQNVTNPMGWLSSCIREGWTNNSRFSGRSYTDIDIANIESELLKK